MARSKVLPARRPRDEESLLLRSAESLGRIIGSLQRQLDGVTGRLSEPSEYATDRPPQDGAGSARDRSTKRAAAPTRDREAARKTTRRSESGGSRVRSTVDRKSTRAAKSAGAKKSAGRQSGARKAARKSTRG